MNIQKTTHALNGEIVDNSPARIRVFYPGGKLGLGAFLGWPTLLEVADDDVVLRREGDEIRVFCVHPAQAAEFWGRA